MASLISRARAALATGSVLMAPLLRARARRRQGGRPVGRRARSDGRDAHPVVRRPADREAGDARRRRRGSGRPGRGGPTAYCGSPPPQRCTWVSTGGAASPTASARSASDQATSSSSLRLQGDRLAVAAQRGAQVHHVPPSGRRTPGRRAHPVPLGEGERRRLDPAAVDRRAPGSRSRSVQRGHAGEVGGAEGQGDHGDRGVLDPGQLGGGHRRDVGRAAGRRARPASPAPRRPRPGRSGAVVGPDASARSPRRCGAARGRSRRSGP